MTNPDVIKPDRTIGKDIVRCAEAGALLGGTISEVVGNILIRHRIIDLWGTAINLVGAGTGAMVVGGLAAAVLEMGNESNRITAEREFLEGERPNPY